MRQRERLSACLACCPTHVHLPPRSACQPPPRRRTVRPPLPQRPPQHASYSQQRRPPTTQTNPTGATLDRNAAKQAPPVYRADPLEGPLAAQSACNMPAQPCHKQHHTAKNSSRVRCVRWAQRTGSTDPATAVPPAVAASCCTPANAAAAAADRAAGPPSGLPRPGPCAGCTAARTAAEQRATAASTPAAPH